MERDELKIVIDHSFAIKKINSDKGRNFLFSRLVGLMLNHPLKSYRDVMMVKKRTTNLVEIRIAMCHIFVTLFDFKLKDAAIISGMREDHSTVLHHIKKHEERYGRPGYETYTAEYDKFLDFICYHWDYITAVPAKDELIEYTPMIILQKYISYNKLRII